MTRRQLNTKIINSNFTSIVKQGDSTLITEFPYFKVKMFKSSAWNVNAIEEFFFQFIRVVSDHDPNLSTTLLKKIDY